MNDQIVLFFRSKSLKFFSNPLSDTSGLHTKIPKSVSISSSKENVLKIDNLLDYTE